MRDKTITKKRVREIVYYANAWCDEYGNERPYSVKEFESLFAAAKKRSK